MIKASGRDIRLEVDGGIDSSTTRSSPLPGLTHLLQEHLCFENLMCAGLSLNCERA